MKEAAKCSELFPPKSKKDYRALKRDVSEDDINFFSNALSGSQNYFEWLLSRASTLVDEEMNPLIKKYSIEQVKMQANDVADEPIRFMVNCLKALKRDEIGKNSFFINFFLL